MRCYLWFGLLGCVIGAGIPIAYGLQTIHAARTAPPLPPGVSACGMSMLGAYISIGIGGPLGGYCFGMMGVVLGALTDLGAKLMVALWERFGSDGAPTTGPAEVTHTRAYNG